ncbi:unnamed protein product [Echinostoma caproni]|uniref:Secreted protein n=1 Tax=Echinostoma caproni TaxID=27848 RepID=A0A183B8H8_9TREM|nr:unnamed protein product [Echinostoma caproni]
MFPYFLIRLVYSSLTEVCASRLEDVAKTLKVLDHGMWVKAEGLWGLAKALRVSAKIMWAQPRGLRLLAKA